MTSEQILKVLKNERESIARQGDISKCDRRCGECDLCLSDEEILAVYDHLIRLCETEAIVIADISEEDKAKIIKSLSEAGYGIHPDLRATLVERVDEEAKAHFNGYCPYTDKPCEKWTCSTCEVAERERKFAKSEDIN